MRSSDGGAGGRGLAEGGRCFLGQFIDHPKQAIATKVTRLIRKMIPKTSKPVVAVSFLVNSTGVGVVKGCSLTCGVPTLLTRRRLLFFMVRAKSLA